MWKLKLASKLGGSNIPGVPGSGLKFAKFARYSSAVSAILLLLLGALGAALDKWWFMGIVCMVLMFPIVFLELPYAPLNFIIKCVNFFADLRYRIAFYIIIALPAFFTVPTIIAGIACFVTAALYGVALFRDEQVELLPLKGQEPQKGAHAPADVESNNKKKHSLSSLGQAEEGEAQPQQQEAGGKKGFFNIRL